MRTLINIRKRIEKLEDEKLILIGELEEIKEKIEKKADSLEEKVEYLKEEIESFRDFLKTIQ